MNKDTFEGKWHELKGKAKEKWGKLTDDDLARINGKREALIGKLQTAYGYAKDKAENELKAWEKECGCDKSSAHEKGFAQQKAGSHKNNNSNWQ